MVKRLWPFEKNIPGRSSRRWLFLLLCFLRFDTVCTDIRRWNVVTHVVLFTLCIIWRSLCLCHYSEMWNSNNTGADAQALGWHGLWETFGFHRNRIKVCIIRKIFNWSWSVTRAEILWPEPRMNGRPLIHVLGRVSMDGNDANRAPAGPESLRVGPSRDSTPTMDQTRRPNNRAQLQRVHPLRRFSEKENLCFQICSRQTEHLVMRHCTERKSEGTCWYVPQ